MNELDASQRQPRDQSAHAHLVGPPSSLAWLVAPAAVAHVTQCPHATADNNYLDERPPQVLISRCGVGGVSDEADDQVVHMQHQQYRRSSDESAEQNSHRKQQQQQYQQIGQHHRRQASSSNRSDGLGEHKQVPGRLVSL